MTTTVAGLPAATSLSIFWSTTRVLTLHVHTHP